jgi:Tfp pilus assembly protein PilO
MIKSASPHQRMIVGTLIAGAVLIAALWMLVLAPKRAESAEARTNLAAQQQRLSDAQTQLAGYETARKQYPGLLAEMGRLDLAVPARSAIPKLLRQLQKRARLRHAELRLAALKPGAAGAAGANLPPGASPRAGGLAALPFTFTYAGKYFDLVHVLAAARKAVTVKSGDLKIDGRLVTIEGVSFARQDPESPTITASIAGTAYIAAAATMPPITTAAVPAATATPGGS